MSVMLSARHARAERIDCAACGVEGLVAWRVDNRVGESPAWDERESCLYWVDVRAPAVFCLDPESDALTRWELPEPVGALGLMGDRTLVLALRRRLAVFDANSGTLATLAELSHEAPHNRLNDGKVSPSGRWFVFGSMDDRPADKQSSGALYCAALDGTVTRLRAELMVANGIAWSPDGAFLYFSDSQAGRVWRAAWDDDGGNMGAPSLFCSADEAAGRPDGATTDVEGHYWSAGVSAGCLNRYAPDGRLAERKRLPCRAPTMPCFGGPDLDLLYFTSLVRPQWLPLAHPWDGALYRLPAGVRGCSSILWNQRAPPSASRQVR